MMQEQVNELKSDFKEIKKQFVTIKITLGIAIGVATILGIPTFFNLNTLNKLNTQAELFRKEMDDQGEKIREQTEYLDEIREKGEGFIQNTLEPKMNVLKEELTSHASKLQITHGAILSQINASLEWELVKKGKLKKFNAGCMYKWVITGSEWHDYENAVFFPTLIKDKLLMSFTYDGTNKLSWETIELGKEDKCIGPNNKSTSAKLYKWCPS